MTTELEYLAKVASERTPGPWVTRNKNALKEWNVYPNEKRSILDPPEEPRQYSLKHSEENMRFIAIAGTVANELIAVARAAYTVTACGSDCASWKDDDCDCGYDEVSDALAALEAAIRGAMK